MQGRPGLPTSCRSFEVVGGVGDGLCFVCSGLVLNVHDISEAIQRPGIDQKLWL